MLPATFTSTEAAAILNLPERRIRKEFEHGVFKTDRRPELGLSALVYLETMRRSGFDFNVADRKKVLDAVEHAMATSLDAVRVSDVVTLHIGQVIHEVTSRAEQFQEWKRRLVRQQDTLGGEPVFPNSRLSVRHVGEIAERGETTQHILEDYPYLTEQDITFARLFAKAYPLVGRPRASRQASAR